MQRLPRRFLEALAAAAPDTRTEDVCADLGFGADLLTTWDSHTAGFSKRYQALVSSTGRRIPLREEELSLRLERYLRELELHHIDEGDIDRTAAAKRAGVSLTDVVRATDKDSAETYDQEFHRRECEIVARQRIAAEDKASNLSILSADDAKAKGWAYQQMSQLTTYLKTWSPRHMQAAQLHVEGRIQHDHDHRMLAGVALHRELRDVSQRFLPSKEKPRVLIVEANP